MVAVAHLALARSQSIRAGILGTKENSRIGCFLLHKDAEKELSAAFWEDYF